MRPWRPRRKACWRRWPARRQAASSQARPSTVDAPAHQGPATTEQGQRPSRRRARCAGMCAGARCLATASCRRAQTLHRLRVRVLPRRSCRPGPLLARAASEARGRAMLGPRAWCVQVDGATDAGWTTTVQAPKGRSYFVLEYKYVACLLTYIQSETCMHNPKHTLTMHLPLRPSFRVSCFKTRGILFCHSHLHRQSFLNDPLRDGFDPERRRRGGGRGRTARA